MMNWIRFLACLLVLISPLPAQELDLAKGYDAGVAALEAGAHDEGLKIVNRVLTEYGEIGLSRYGPSFGHFHYLKGMLLIGKKQFGDAMASLQTAVEDYGNDKRESGQPPNVFHNHARMQWGMCLQALGNHSEAAKKFEAVLEADKGAQPKINRTAVEMNLARCYLKLNREAEGKAILSRLLGGDGLSSDAIQDAFTVMAVEDEQGMDVMGLVREHAGALFGSEKNRSVMNPRLAGLAAKSLNAGDFAQALVWYNLMTPPGDELREKQAEIARLQQQRRQAQEVNRQDLVAKIDEALSERNKAVAEIEERHRTSLLGMGAAHYQIGSLSAAYAVFQEMLRQFSSFPERAQILHNAVLCATNLERWEDASQFGNQFFSEFPSHPLKDRISRVLAEVVFTRGDYGTALTMGKEARKGVASGTPERAALDFVVAASLAQENQWEEAERELHAYLAAYPEGENSGTVLFMLGSLKTKQAR